MKTLIYYICLVVISGLTHSSVAKSPVYTGSTACKDCHQQQYSAWADSHHSWAWREPIAENVLGDFNNTSFTHAGFTYRFFTEERDYFVVADNPAGKATKYKIHSIAGVTPLQQYLVETRNGRLQALDVAWDTENKRWYHLYPELIGTEDSGMHWSGSYKNWNARCAECHATDFRKDYDPLKGSYKSTQAEIGVGCEACHGPGEAHLTWAYAPEKYTSRSWKGTNAIGLTAAYLRKNAASEINLCAGCHSRREPIGAKSPEPGSLYDDHYRLALLRDELYFSDGQIQEEVYVYGSFLQSKMYEKEIKCSNCHETHSYRLKVEGNALCTQCHNPTGNALFPSLKRKYYDSSAHHFHKTDSEGAECKQCHMPERHYMIVDGRRDHSFRIPRPDLTEKLGTPNVCNSCHTDRTSAWAISEIIKRYPEGQSNTRHFAEIFSVSDIKLDDQAANQLIELAKNDLIPAIVRASALERLLPIASQLHLKTFDSFLYNENAWIRAAAINIVVMSSIENKKSKLLPLLNDPVRSVRLAAVKGFFDGNLEGMSFSDSLAVKKALKEYQQSLYDKADFPETQMVIGGVALTTKNISAAISAFNQAVKMDPQLIQAWVMLARIQAALGNAAEVKHTLSKAISANPNSDLLRELNKHL